MSDLFGLNGIFEKIGVGLTMSRRLTDPPVQIMISLVGGIVGMAYGQYKIYTTMGAPYMALPLIVMYIYYQVSWLATPPADTEKYLIFKDAALKKKWGKNKIPMHILVEEFLADNVAFKKDCYDTLADHREEFIDWRPNYDLIRFIVAQIFPISSSSFKSIKATAHEIADHYDRGNDFFNAFLGPMMIYTSAFYQGLDQNLEQAQINKLNMLCEKVHLKPGMTFLDIGCGWGTLARHAASQFGAKATGVTLSAEGAAWCREQANKEGLSETQCEILNCDYREIDCDKKEKRTFDAISAVEMAEHVGIANFGLFLDNVRTLLNDDGIFYMQVAGLRKGSNWQDTQWGLFMSRYIFPGADASTPLYWYTKQLELAGFEVHSVENVGRHYSHTLHAWYDNWMKNKDAPALKDYPDRLKRLWEIFLAWSVVASGIGSATCYQIVAHKNTYTFPRDTFCSKESAGTRTMLRS
jgi:cyclopropane fatty-acyl-phospholipid synthase-like methyltransferase